MATEFGKFIRIRRLKLDTNMGEMARNLGVSSAFLSSIELGKQYCSDKVFTGICQLLKLSEQEIKQLDDLRKIAVSNSSFVKLSVREKDKERLVQFARMLSDNRLSDDEQDELDNLLNRGKKYE